MEILNLLPTTSKLFDALRQAVQNRVIFSIPHGTVILGFKNIAMMNSFLTFISDIHHHHHTIDIRTIAGCLDVIETKPSRTQQGIEIEIQHLNRL